MDPKHELAVQQKIEKATCEVLKCGGGSMGAILQQMFAPPHQSGGEGGDGQDAVPFPEVDLASQE